MKKSKQSVLLQAAKDNPDLPVAFVRELIQALRENKKKASIFMPQGKR